MLLSVHPRPYDMDAARADNRYARFFTYGWHTFETRSSKVFSDFITSAVWSPCIFRDGHRRIESFVEARLLVLDFDHPGYTLEQALSDWCDTIHWIGTTKNHQREKGGITCDRFRIVVPFARAITNVDEYNYNYQLVARQYDAADQCTKDGARLFFPCQEVVSICTDGFPQGVLDLPQEIIDNKQRQEAVKEFQRENRIIPNRLRAVFELPIESGKQSNTIYGVSKELAYYGFDGKRLLDMFLASPTYSGQVQSPSTIKKVRESIENGIKASRREGSGPHGG